MSVRVNVSGNLIHKSSIDQIWLCLGFFLPSSIEWYLKRTVQETDQTLLSNRQPSSIAHPAWQAAAAWAQLCGAGLSVLLMGQTTPSICL